MKAILALRFRMYVAVKSELQAIVNSVGIAGLSALLDVLTAKMEELDALHPIQTLVTPPQTKARNDVLDDMIAAAFAVAGPLRAQAHQQRLHAVEAVATITEKSFRRTRLIEKPLVAQKIHDSAVPLVVALTPLGVTEPILVDFQAKIDAAKAMLNEPRTTIIDRHRATERMDELFAEIDELLQKQIDGVMAPLKLTQPQLYKGYLDARKAHLRRPPVVEEPATTATTAIAAPSPAEKIAA